MTKLFHITTSPPLLSSSAKPNKGNPGSEKERERRGRGDQGRFAVLGGWLWTVASLSETIDGNKTSNQESNAFCESSVERVLSYCLCVFVGGGGERI